MNNFILAYSGPMFEVFLVVGLKSSEEKQPEILFQYPAETYVHRII